MEKSTIVLICLIAVAIFLVIWVMSYDSNSDYSDYEDDITPIEHIEDEPITEGTDNKDKKSDLNSIVLQTQDDNSEEIVDASETLEGLEIPMSLNDNPELLISHTGFSLSFNTVHNTPNWVAWYLDAERVSGRYARTNDYDVDPKLPAQYRITSDEFTGLGYDRGHMCPAADVKWNASAMHESFYMSNICPQDNYLNSGGWNKVEEACRRWAPQEGKIYIVCGPVYNGTIHKIGRYKKVSVPTGFFKVVLSLNPGKEKAIGFYYENNNTRQRMGDAACSVDDIERLTGYDFFYQLDDSLEERLESTYNLGKWH